MNQTYKIIWCLVAIFGFVSPSHAQTALNVLLGSYQNCKNFFDEYPEEYNSGKLSSDYVSQQKSSYKIDFNPATSYLGFFSNSTTGLYTLTAQDQKISVFSTLYSFENGDIYVKGFNQDHLDKTFLLNSKAPAYVKNYITKVLVRTLQEPIKSEMNDKSKGLRLCVTELLSQTKYKD